jgi:hypothetical protein
MVLRRAGMWRSGMFRVGMMRLAALKLKRGASVDVTAAL